VSARIDRGERAESTGRGREREGWKRLQRRTYIIFVNDVNASDEKRVIKCLYVSSKITNSANVSNEGGVYASRKMTRGKKNTKKLQVEKNKAVVQEEDLSDTSSRRIPRRAKTKYGSSSHTIDIPSKSKSLYIFPLCVLSPLFLFR
jgi:hypothetical protein